MKGMIFCEFLEMAEETFGIVVVDEVLETTELPSGGIYTSVGTYDHQELIAMVIRLSQITKTPLPDLLQTYGQNLFGKLMETLPQFIPQNQDCFEFIKAIDSSIPMLNYHTCAAMKSTITNYCCITVRADHLPKLQKACYWVAQIISITHLR